MKRKLIALFSLLLLLAAGGAWRLCQPPDAGRAEELLASLSREGYSFTARAVVRTAGVETPFFEISGRVDGEDSQISGTVLGQPAELSYSQGLLSQVLPDGSSISHELSDLGELGQLYAELLPQSAFAHQGVAAFSSRRRGWGWELRLRPELCGGWVDAYFRDPLYTVVCGPLGRQAQSFALEATEKVNGEAALVLEIELTE